MDWLEEQQTWFPSHEQEEDKTPTKKIPRCTKPLAASATPSATPSTTPAAASTVDQVLHASRACLRQVYDHPHLRDDYVNCVEEQRDVVPAHEKEEEKTRTAKRRRSTKPLTPSSPALPTPSPTRTTVALPKLYS